MSQNPMSLSFVRRHPLESLVADPPLVRAVDHLDLVRGPAIVLVLAVEGEEAEVAAGLAAGDDLGVRFVAPCEWLVVSPTGAPDTLARDLGALFGDTAYISDQSDGRSLLRLSGPNVRRILAKGIGVDLHPSAFDIGMSANVLCGHISVNLARVDDNTFEIVVMRSFAESLLHDLTTMGVEFDLSVGFLD